MKPPPPASESSSTSSSIRTQPTAWRRLLTTALRWLGEGLLFTPLLAYYMVQRGFARSLPIMAMENCLYRRLFAACLLSPRPPHASTRRHSRRRTCGLGFAATLVFCHAFLIGSQITALALMATKMNAEFIYNIVHAVRTNTWGQTDAKLFFPTVVLLTLAGEWACLFGWWGRLAHAVLRPLLAKAVGHHRRLTPRVQRALHRLRKALEAGSHDDGRPPPSQQASQQQQQQQLRGGKLALAFLCFWAFKHRFPCFPKRAAYSPVANTFFATVQYAARDEFRRSQAERMAAKKKAQRHAANANGKTEASYFERVQLPPLESTRKTNVVFILNDSLGNRILKSEKGLEAFPFYRDRIFSGADPAFFDFENNRACAGNTNAAAPAALTGFFLGAKDFHPDSWDYWGLPTLFTLAARMGYARALFCPYDSEDWWPFTDIFQGFDRVTSRTTLGCPVVNDMGCDDRIVMESALEHIREQGRRQREEEEGAPPFVLVLMWNNMHRPFLQRSATPLASEERNMQYRSSVGYQSLFANNKGEAAAAEALSITQDMTAALFDALEEAGLQGNTLVSFLSDHGESTQPASTRLNRPSTLYLASPLWLHVPPSVLQSMPDAAAATLRANRHRLVSNLDLMPTLVELLGWSEEGALFRGLPSIFGHGQSLLRPIAANRVAAGWQGQPFVDACEWTFGLLHNATHTLVLRAEENDAILEEVGGHDGADVVRDWDFGELSVEDQAYWRRELVEKRPDMHEALKQCFFDYGLGLEGSGGGDAGREAGRERAGGRPAMAWAKRVLGLAGGERSWERRSNFF